MQFSFYLPQILSQNLLGYHRVSVSGNSEVMHCGIRINMPYCYLWVQHNNDGSECSGQLKYAKIDGHRQGIVYSLVFQLVCGVALSLSKGTQLTCRIMIISCLSTCHVRCQFTINFNNIVVRELMLFFIWCITGSCNDNGKINIWKWCFSSWCKLLHRFLKALSFP